MQESDFCPSVKEVQRFRKVEVEFSRPGHFLRERMVLQADRAACIQYASDLFKGRVACRDEHPQKTRPAPPGSASARSRGEDM